MKKETPHQILYYKWRYVQVRYTYSYIQLMFYFHLIFVLLFIFGDYRLSFDTVVVAVVVIAIVVGVHIAVAAATSEYKMSKLMSINMDTENLTSRIIWAQITHTELQYTKSLKCSTTYGEVWIIIYTYKMGVCVFVRLFSVLHMCNVINFTHKCHMPIELALLQPI